MPEHDLPIEDDYPVEEPDDQHEEDDEELDWPAGESMADHATDDDTVELIDPDEEVE